MRRRELLLGSIGTGILALVDDGVAAPATDPILAALKNTVGTRAKGAAPLPWSLMKARSRLAVYMTFLSTEKFQ